MKFAVRGMGCLWGVALLLAGLSACGSSSGKCTSNCNTDGSVDVAVRADHPVETDDGGSRDAPADADEPKGPIDGAVACDQSIAAACASTADAGAFTFHCAATWAATTSTAYFCGRPQTTVLTETCGSERQLFDTNNAGTAEYIYVFDSTGKLSAISYSAGAGGTVHCVAGPQEFVAPVGCNAPDLFTCATDGGHKG
jgi:hypothetical protein